MLILEEDIISRKKEKKGSKRFTSEVQGHMRWPSFREQKEGRQKP